MPYTENNRFWLKLFVKDFLRAEEKFLARANITPIPVETFYENFVEKERRRKIDKDYILKNLNRFNSLSSGFVLKCSGTNINMAQKVKLHLYERLKELDPKNQLGIKNITFDLVHLSTNSFTLSSKYYMLICDVSKYIDFELVYGSLKVINIM